MPPPVNFFTPPQSPLLTDRATPVPEQGEHHLAGISSEPAASGEEGSQRLEPPQEEPPVPGDSPSSTSSFAHLADPRLHPGEPPATPTGRARFLSRRRCPTSTMTPSRWIRTRSNAPHLRIPLRTPCLTDEWGKPLKQPAEALRLAGQPVNFSRAAQLFELNFFHFISNTLLCPVSKINPDRFSAPN